MIKNLINHTHSAPLLPWINVLVAVYNQEEFIEECLTSIIQQDYPKIKIIIGDDASTDRSSNIIRSFSKKYPEIIIPIFNKMNLGVAGNVSKMLNSGFVSEGLINFFAGDDIMLPGRFKAIASYLSANPQLGGCYHDCDVFDTNSGKTLFSYSKRFSMSSGGIEEYLSGKMKFSINTFFCWTHLLPQNNYHDEELKGYADFDYLIRTIDNMDQKGLHHPIGFIKDSYIRYRRHQNNLSNIRNSFTFFCEVKPFLKISQTRPDLRKICERAYSEKCVTYLIFFLLHPYKMRDLPLLQIFKAVLKSPRGILKALFNGLNYIKCNLFVLHKKI